MITVQRRPGWWYPYIFVAGFMLVLLVNLTMAYFANSTFSGLATENPYEKGLAYNKTLAAARHQEELGWQIDTKVEPGPDHGAAITVSYRSRDGKPLTDLTVTAELVRPTAKGQDRQIVLASIAPGTYATQQQLPLSGVWDLAIAAKGAEGSYQLSRRILVP